jgi:phosphonate transport system ATP-binding protein
MTITVRRLSKRFRSNGRQCCALDQVDLDIADGEMVALIGPSGSGKSTLMRHIAGLIAGDPGEGDVLFDGRTVQSGGRISREIRDLRCSIGFIFQQFNLVGRLDVLTNVLAGAIHRHPMWRTLAGVYPMQERLAAMRCLERVGMDDKAAQRASTLSGGQQQRVAIARAMLQGAKTILADEPIASLDPSSARRVMETLARINREDRTTVVVSLHQVEYARNFCTRAIALRAGKVVFDGPAADLTDDRLLSIYHHALDGEDGSGDQRSGTSASRPTTAPEPEPVLV